MFHTDWTLHFIPFTRQCLEMYHMSIKKMIAEINNNMIPQQQYKTIQSTRIDKQSTENNSPVNSHCQCMTKDMENPHTGA